MLGLLTCLNGLKNDDFICIDFLRAELPSVASGDRVASSSPIKEIVGLSLTVIVPSKPVPKILDLLLTYLGSEMQI